MRYALALALALAAAPVLASDPFPVAVGGPFTLRDAATGARRTGADPGGLHQILYFGYANCPDMCQTTLPHVADVVDALAARGIAVRPVMITVDPERDRGPEMAAILAEVHPRFVGLTGSARALRQVWQAFGVSTEPLFLDPAGQPVLAHTGHLFLLDPEGRVETVLPPVLPIAQTADIVARYAGGAP